MLLKKIMFEYCVAYKFETVSQRYYREFNSELDKIDEDKLKTYTIPQYLPFTKILI